MPVAVPTVGRLAVLEAGLADFFVAIDDQFALGNRGVELAELVGFIDERRVHFVAQAEVHGEALVDLPVELPKTVEVMAVGLAVGTVLCERRAILQAEPEFGYRAGVEEVAVLSCLAGDGAVVEIVAVFVAVEEGDVVAIGYSAEGAADLDVERTLAVGNDVADFKDAVVVQPGMAKVVGAGTLTAQQVTGIEDRDATQAVGRMTEAASDARRLGEAGSFHCLNDGVALRSLREAVAEVHDGPAATGFVDQVRVDHPVVRERHVGQIAAGGERAHQRVVG